MRKYICKNPGCSKKTSTHWCSKHCHIEWILKETKYILKDVDLQSEYNKMKENRTDSRGVSLHLKHKFKIPGNLKNFRKFLISQGISLSGMDNIYIDEDNPNWSFEEWCQSNKQICCCGCGKIIPLRAVHRTKGIPKYLKNHINIGKHYSKSRKENISKSLTGKKMSNEFKEKRRVYMKDKWKDKDYRKNHIKMQIKINADPDLREKHSQTTADWIIKHPEHIQRLIVINKQWAKDHPEKKMEAAKAGCRALAIKKKKSSIELKMAAALSNANILFEEQWSHDLGVADFLVENKIVVFADGDYWHRRPGVQTKDTRQNEYLKKKGFYILRFWESEINTDINQCIQKIQQLIKNL